MRAFVAAEIPLELREQMAAVRDGLKGAGVEATWVRPAGVHLTLKFLGEVSEELVSGIEQALRVAAGDKGPFRLGIEGVGTFPNATSPRVVWLGITGETSRLAELQAAVEHAMAGLGLERDQRPYAPHLTLGRIKRIRNRDAWLKALERVKTFRLPGFDVASISLISSELKPGGAVYRELATVALPAGTAAASPTRPRPDRPPR